MIEDAVKEILRSDSGVMTLLGNDPEKCDLLTIASGKSAPYITFNVDKSVQAGRPSLCDPSSVGLLNTTLMFTPWAETATEVDSIHKVVRVALLSFQRRVAAGVAIQSIQWQSYQPWAMDEITHLLTRGQVFSVIHAA